VSGHARVTREAAFLDRAAGLRHGDVRRRRRGSDTGDEEGG
jgi:hypothetical protein